MLAYLHATRPKNRRSANLLDSSSQNTDQIPIHNKNEDSPDAEPDLPTLHPPRPNSSRPSPVSTAPPLLPPIPRIASKHHKNNDRPVQQRHWSFKGSSQQPGPTPGESSLLPWSSQGRGSAAPSSLHQSTIRHVQETSATSSLERQRSESGRQKRPIDLRFDEMKSYHERPFQQSIYYSYHIPQIIPQPFSPPTPPPKKSEVQPPSGANRIDTGQQDTLDVHRTRLSENRFNTWNQKIFSHAQRQPTVSNGPLPPFQSTFSTNQQRNGKPKLNLRNPMALLARRRSHRIKESGFAGNKKTLPMKLPDDFDPRIRGNVVHDFSVPRAGRQPATKADDEMARSKRQRVEQSSLPVTRDTSPCGGEREHTPVFKEHFDVGLEKAQDPEQKSESLQRLAAAASQPQPNSSQLPSFARNLPSSVSSDVEIAEKTPSQQNNGSLRVLVEAPEQGQSYDVPSPTFSPPRAASTSASISDRSTSGLGSPQRYRSTSSRFSFDLAGVGSAAQEKILEDKHRQKVQQKHRQSILSDDRADDDEPYLDFDNDEDAAYEERIPGVNCDSDDELPLQTPMPTLQRDMENFQLASPNKSSFESTTSPVSTGFTSLDTPRDFLSLPWANTLAAKSSPNLTQIRSGETQLILEPKEGSRPRSTPDNASKGATLPQPLQREAVSDTNIADLPQRQSLLDDDMYFDDGMIDEIGDVSDQGFDEDVFDDTGHGLYGLPLRDRTLKPLEQPPQIVEIESAGKTSRRLAPSSSVQSKDGLISPSPQRSISSGGLSAELRDALTELGQPTQPVFSQTAGLTHDNLAAYNHNALAMAVNKAADDGAFDRVSGGGPTQEAKLNPQDLSTLGVGNAPAPGVSFNLPENDEYGDDELDDDPIVAAANAEALENDDDGFYGQEFGFYARASASNDVDEYANGGYFGPRSMEGIHRSHSGKANFQEPSLTPITERSEWSNRNSFIFGHPMSAAAAANAQFNDQSVEDLNAQFAMLKQLRRGAWGGNGSNMSLQSSSDSQNSGSPITYVGPGMMLPSSLQTSKSGVNQPNGGASFSFSSSNGRPSSNDSDSNGSPTITLPIQQTSGLSMPPQTMPTTAPTSEAIAPSPLLPDSRPTSSRGNGLRGHSRNSSGAESVSYKEEGGKWVIEKRRMSETGETIVGRSVIAGARI